MGFKIESGLLDACALAILVEGDTYGYEITQSMKRAIVVSESTLYPVLRRLQKDGCLTVRDEAYNGRNRRYYEVTEAGRDRLEAFQEEWEAYTSQINKLFKGEPL